MSSLVPRCLALGVAVLLSLPAPTRAQQTEQELVQHLDSLLPLLRQAQEESRAAKEAQREAMETRVVTEEVDVGLVRVMVVPGQADIARDVIGPIWEREYAPWVDASPNLASDRVFFEWTAGDFTSLRIISYEVRAVQGARFRSRAYMERGVRQVISETLKDDIRHSSFYQDWNTHGFKAPEAPQNLYREAFTSPSFVARACVTGDDRGCLAAFGLVGGETRLSDWYNTQERRLLVMRNASRFSGNGAEEVARCRGGATEACDGLLNDYWRNWTQGRDRLWAHPFQADLRTSLLWYALQQGGQGAWSRLLEHQSEPPLAVLEAASGMSGEALVAGWRSWLMEHRPVTKAGLGSVALGALFWIALLFALATRSTRWRLG